MGYIHAYIHVTTYGGGGYACSITCGVVWPAGGMGRGGLFLAMEVNDRRMHIRMIHMGGSMAADYVHVQNKGELGLGSGKKGPVSTIDEPALAG